MAGRDIKQRQVARRVRVPGVPDDLVEQDEEGCDGEAGEYPV